MTDDYDINDDTIRIKKLRKSGRKIDSMILIVGGAYQGKEAWAKKHYSEVHWIDGENCREEDIYQCQGIFHFHKYLERLMRNHYEEKEENVDSIDRFAWVTDLAERLYRENQNIVIVTDEIGYGIVPMDPFERTYREVVGRVCTKLAKNSESVYRVVCGIEMKLK